MLQMQQLFDTPDDTTQTMQLQADGARSMALNPWTRVNGPAFH